MIPSPTLQMAPPELMLRLHQQELVAEFGLFAMEGRPIHFVLDEACRVAASGLDTQFAKVLQYLPAERAFVVRAGIGWKSGVVGVARLGSDLESPAGFAFRTERPVISNHLAAETRFRTPALLADHGIHRAINVLIRGADGAPFGVLEADSTDRTDFTGPDTAFLQSLANSVAAAVAMEARLAALRDSEAFSRGVLDASPDCIMVLDAGGPLLFMNGNGQELMEIDDLSPLLGTSWDRLWPEAGQGKLHAALKAARAGETARFEISGPTARGTPKCWEVVVAPIESSHARPDRLVAIAREITGQVQARAAKDALLREKDLLMQEVHHRVKNSLQMVHTLLSLQSRTLSDPSAKQQLDEAAARIMTVAAAHRRLYQGGSVQESDAGAYLASLLDDLRDSLPMVEAGREIRFHIEPMVLSADVLTPFGLITTELVTNALKYGSGAVTVRARPVAEGIELAVEDEGPGFPPDFVPLHGNGLGMRLAATLSRSGETGIRIDRDVDFARIVVLLKSPS